MNPSNRERTTVLNNLWFPFSFVASAAFPAAVGVVWLAFWLLWDWTYTEFASLFSSGALLISHKHKARSGSSSWVRLE